MTKAQQFLEASETNQKPKTFLVGHSGRKYQFIVSTDDTDTTTFDIVDNRSEGGAIKNIDVDDINTFISVLNHIKKGLKK